MNSIVHPKISHLIVQRRLIDEREICILSHQFPNVKYLQLLFPLQKSSFNRCFQILFSGYDSIDKESRFWPHLVSFYTVHVYGQSNSIITDSILHHWLIKNTDLKYHKFLFYANCYDSMVSIWL
jgi:hypothetical protein